VFLFVLHFWFGVLVIDLSNREAKRKEWEELSELKERVHH